MMLPLPNPAPAYRSRTASRRPSPGRFLLRCPIVCIAPPGAVPLRLLRISNTACRWTAPRPGWSPARTIPRRAVRRLEPKEYRPMTVRWKPLLFLSGLFLVVALIGVVAITLTTGAAVLAGHPQVRPRGPRGRPIRGCRDLLQAGPPDRAQERAIHEEFAGLYRDWAAAHGRRKAARPLRAEWLDHIAQGRQVSTRRLKGPRKDLLHDAMDQDLALGRDLLGQGAC